MNKFLQDKYSKLVRAVETTGERFPKKHGHWIRKNIFKDFWLILDTWNRSIILKKGSCDYDNMYTGFTNCRRVRYLGIDFGGCRVHVSGSDLDYYRLKVLTQTSK